MFVPARFFIYDPVKVSFVLHRKGLGAEHPLNDVGQGVFLVVYLGIWGLDSFIFRLSTLYADFIPIPLRFLLGALSLITGAYLVAKSGSAVFRSTHKKPELVTTGVYSYVRHPMYLGGLLFLLSFFFVTFSLISLLVWTLYFVFLDRMATYEEKDLERILGEQYISYQKSVPKWIPGVTKRRLNLDERIRHSLI